MWGGNWPEGIDWLRQFYPSKKEFSDLDPRVQKIWGMEGVDCSGLPHYLTNGLTPRNTSALLKYGESVPIKGMTPDRIIDRLQDLDFIVWRGHVIWVENQEHCIESRYPEGLVRSELDDRLSEIMETRKPVDDLE